MCAAEKELCDQFVKHAIVDVTNGQMEMCWLGKLIFLSKPRDRKIELALEYVLYSIPAAARWTTGEKVEEGLQGSNITSQLTDSLPIKVALIWLNFFLLAHEKVSQ